jgi:hypothetical protein
MPTGLLGQAALTTATQWTSVYVVPSNTFSVLSLNVLNRGTTAVGIRIALTGVTPPSAPTNAELIEYDVQIGANGVLERTGIMMNATKILAVYATNTNVSVSVYGIETSTL